MLGSVAKYQLASDQEAAINALSAGGISGPVIGSDEIRIFKVTNVQDRLPDATQVDTLKTDAFNNWYASVKSDPKQITIERLVSTSSPGVCRPGDAGRAPRR